MQPASSDAERIAKALLREIAAREATLGIDREECVAAIEELLRAGVIFPGPSLYAEDTA
jgi:hypothetical protein